MNEIKALARKAAFAARKTAFGAGQGQAAEILADYLAAHGGRPLAGYMAMRTETDPVVAMAAHQGPVCVPVIIAPGQPLRFREWTPGCAMIAGTFGAAIPAEGSKQPRAAAVRSRVTKAATHVASGSGCIGAIIRVLLRSVVRTSAGS